MRVFKLHSFDVKEEVLTKENFKKLTQERKPYVQIFPGKEKNGFALCPCCNNPIRIVGLYRPIKNDIAAYAKHYEGDVPGVGKYNRYLYINCKYAINMRNVCPKEERNPELTQYGENIYDTVKKYFDKAIYVLQESIGINITSSMAEKMLCDYVYSYGCMYPFHTINNIPWMIMYLSDYSIELYGQCVRTDSEIYKKLQEIQCLYFEDIPIDEQSSESKKKFAKKYKILKAKKYTQISVLFQRHYREKKNDDEVSEYIYMTVSYRHNSDDKWIYNSTIRVEIEDKWFQKLLHSGNAMKFRDTKLLQIAEENMPGTD